MAVFWTVLEVMVLLLYWDLPSLQGSILRQTMDYTYRQDSDSQFLPPTPSPTMVLPVDPEPDQSGIAKTGSDVCESPVGDAAIRTRPKRPRQYPSIDVAITSSNEMIESAERFIVAGSADSGPIMFSATPTEEEVPPGEAGQVAEDDDADVAFRDGSGGYGALNGGVSPALRSVEDEAYIQQQPQESANNSVSTEAKPASTEKLSWSYYYDGTRV